MVKTSSTRADKERAMHGTDHTTGTIRELAHRSGDGIDVTLYWDSRDGRLTVSVFDGRSGEFFEIAAPRHAALDVFNHPFAYAGREHDAALPVGSPAQLQH
jgi:hypothetical protein